MADPGPFVNEGASRHTGEQHRSRAGATRRLPRDISSVDTGWLIAFLIAVIFSRGLDHFFVPMANVSLGQTLVVVVIAVLLAQAIAGAPMGEWRVGAASMAVLLGLGVASIAYANDVMSARAEVVHLVENSFVLFAILLGIRTRRHLRLAFWAVIVGCAVMAALNLYQLATGTFNVTYWGIARGQQEVIVGGVLDYRIGGPGLGPNGLAHALVFGLPFAIERAKNETRAYIRVVAGASVALIGAGIIFTYSRNGFLTMGTTILLLAVYFRFSIRRVVAIVGIGALTFVTIAPQQYFARVATLLHVGRSESSLSSGRASEYLAAVQMFAEHPITGVGMGNYPARYLEYSERIGIDTRREDRAAHSLYLQFAAELGAMGLVWLIGTIAVALIGLHTFRHRAAHVGDREAHQMSAAAEAALIAFLMFSLFRHMALARYFLIAIALALATVHAASPLRPGALRDDG